MKVNDAVQTGEPSAHRVRITAAEISEVKRHHILKNLLYTPAEAGQILGKSERTIQELVKDGKLVAADDSASRGRKMSCGYRITAESLETYRSSIIVPPENFGK